MEIPHFYPGRFRFSCRLKTVSELLPLQTGGQSGSQVSQVAADFHPSLTLQHSSSQRRTALRSKVRTGRRAGD